MPMDGTDIVRSLPAIGRPLRFPMDIVITALPTPIHDAAQTTVRYLQPSLPLASACPHLGLVPPELSNDPVVNTNTVPVHTLVPPVP